MSGTFPTSPGFARFDVSSNQNVVISISDSGKRQSRKTGGHLWEIRATLPPMKQSAFAPIDAFIVSQQGALETFDVTNAIDNLGTWIGDTGVTVDGAHAADVTTVNLTGLTTGNTVKAGDIFRTSDHAKVYKVTADATADVSGNVALSIMPPLLEAVPDTNAVTHTSVLYSVALKTAVHKFKTSNPGFFRYELDLIEALT